MFTFRVFPSISLLQPMAILKFGLLVCRLGIFKEKFNKDHYIPALY